jgi:hypothetical protein
MQDWVRQELRDLGITDAAIDASIRESDTVTDLRSTPARGASRIGAKAVLALRATRPAASGPGSSSTAWMSWRRRHGPCTPPWARRTDGMMGFLRAI